MCGVFWRSDARSSCGRMRRSVVGLFMQNHHSLTVLTSIKNCQTTNLLGCKKPSKMVPPADMAPDENVVDVDKLAKEEVRKYITHATYTNAVKLEDNPLVWWKQHGHLFPTLSRLARRYLATQPRPALLNVCSQLQVKWTLLGGPTCCESAVH